MKYLSYINFFIILCLSSKILAMEYNSLHEIVESSDIDNLSVFLSTKHIDINEKNKSGNTALHIAAQKDSMEMCRILVQYGAKKNIKNRDKKIPAELAIDRAVQKFLMPDRLYDFDEDEDDWFLEHPIATFAGLAVLIVYFAWLSRDA